MIRRLLEKLGFGASTTDRPADDKASFAELNSMAPLKDEAAVPTSIPQSVGPGQHPDANFICREAVLNRAQRITGYEFLLRKSTRQRIPDRAMIRRAYDDVLLRGLATMDVGRLLGHRFAMAGIIPESLNNPQINQLPRQGMIIKLSVHDLGRFAATEQVLTALKQAGFSIALEGFADGLPSPGLLRWADHVSVDITAQAPDRISQIRRLASTLNADIKMMASKLESYEDFDLCYSLGFDFFQGPFVTRREQWKQQKPDASRIHICNLLNRLRRDAETTELVEALKRDAVLSYRLLRYINSPGSGLLHKVTSLDQAIVVLGREKLYRWLSLLLFTAGAPDPRMWLLMENSLIRARLMELLGRQRRSAAEQEQLFMVGIFSLLDLILGMPMEEALKQVNLPEPVAQTLAGKHGPYLPYLRLAIACEAFDQERIAAAAALCCLDLAAVNRLHVAALAWSQDIQESDSAGE